MCQNYFFQPVKYNIFTCKFENFPTDTLENHYHRYCKINVQKIILPMYDALVTPVF